jgi:hypothetical protein
MAADVEERLSELRFVTDRSVDIALHYVGPHVWEPGRRSEAEAELNNSETGSTGPWGDRPVRTSYAMANAGTTALLDQLTALSRLATQETPALASTVIARSAVEIGSGIWWLMEPGIGVRRRVSRYLAEELESMERAKQVVERLGLPPELRDYLDGPNQVRKKIADLGLVAGGGRYQPIVGGESRPDATTLTSEHLSALLDTSKIVYNVYSAVTHGTLYGVMQFFDEDPDHPGSSRWASSLKAIEHSIQTGLATLLLTVDRIIAVMGWDDHEWESWKPAIANAYP